MKLMVLAAIAALSIAALPGPSVLSAKEISAPAGCWLKLDRQGTWVCCKKPGATVCRLQDSQIPTRSMD